MDGSKRLIVRLNEIMKITKTLLLAGSLTLASPVFAQPLSLDLVGSFNLIDGSGTAHETFTGCRYIIDPAQPAFPQQVVIHPAPPQPATCRTLAFPEDTTSFNTTAIPFGTGEFDITLLGDPTRCLTALRGKIIEGVGTPSFSQPQESQPDSFRAVGATQWNQNNDPACRKVQRK
jgi:hypothetical protein